MGGWRRLGLWIAIGLAASAIFLPRLDAYSLWNPDEPRYALVAKEMAEADDQLLPRLNGEPYTEKPPLFFWAVEAAGAMTGGVDETATRLPSALAVIGATLLVFSLGRRLFSERAGWIAAAAFATSVKVVWQGRVGQIDMLLAFLVALAVWAWVRSRGKGEGRWVWLFWVAAGVGTVAKGPVALVPALLSILVFLALTRDREGFRRLRLGWGLLVYAGVVLAWLVPAVVHAGAWYLDELVLRQTVTRYVDPWHHFHSWFYYLGATAGNYFPWTVFLPTAAFVAWKELEGSRRRNALFAGCWAVVTIVFFSVSPAKRDVYVLPMYPAMALLVGASIDRIVEIWPGRRRWLEVPLIALAAIAGVAAVAAPSIFRRWPDLIAVAPELAGGTAAALVFLALGAAGGWVLVRNGRPVPAVASLSAGTVTMAFLLAVVLVPRLEPFRSLRPVSEVVAREVPPDEPLGIFPRFEPAISFYCGRRVRVLETEEELRSFVAAPGLDWVLIRASDLDEIEPRPRNLVTIGERTSRPYYLWKEGS